MPPQEEIKEDNDTMFSVEAQKALGTLNHQSVIKIERI